MIDLKMEQLEMRLTQALKQFRANETYKLTSFTKSIESKNLLHLFEGVKLSNKDRFYWMSASRRLAFTAVGKVKTLEADEERFEQTEKQWKQLLNEAIIDNPYPKVPGTGLLAFGGMSFDPLEERTELWQNFKQSQFYIPEIILTEYDEKYYLTLNTVLSKTDNPSEIADYLQALAGKFLHGEKIENQMLKIEKETEVDPVRWKQSVQKAREEIAAKKAEKIVLAREVRLHFDQEVNVASVLQKLLDTQQNSYVYAFESGGDCFIGATPERLVKVENNDLLSTCLAGTAPRGKTEEEDKEIGKGLLHDQKNREEHEFVVKMIKNALLHSCTDVIIPKEPVLYPLKNLQHLYTPVTGQLKNDYSIFDVVRALHPTPALGGTPTTESLAFIRENELLDRGWYGAPIGWLDSNNNGEFAVAIRSGLIQGDEASLFAGCGVVANSDPTLEYEETKIKLMPMLHVLGGETE